MKINAKTIKEICHLKKESRIKQSKLDCILLDIIQDITDNCAEQYEITDHFYECIPDLQSLGFSVSDEVTDSDGSYRIVKWE